MKYFVLCEVDPDCRLTDPGERYFLVGVWQDESHWSVALFADNCRPCRGLAYPCEMQTLSPEAPELDVGDQIVIKEGRAVGRVTIMRVDR